MIDYSPTHPLKDSKSYESDSRKHSDQALAYLCEHNSGVPMSLVEIAEFTGMQLSAVNKSYASGINKLRKRFREIETLEDVKR